MSLESLLEEARAGRFAKRPVKPATTPLAPPPGPPPIQSPAYFDGPGPGEQAELHQADSPKPKAKAPRRKDGKRAYMMDFIPDKQLYAAVMFARELMREGQSPDYANGWAAKKYKVAKRDVARYTGQCAGTVGGRR